jgi:hypothetical protein
MDLVHREDGTAINPSLPGRAVGYLVGAAAGIGLTYAVVANTSIGENHFLTELTGLVGTTFSLLTVGPICSFLPEVAADSLDRFFDEQANKRTMCDSNFNPDTDIEKLYSIPMQHDNYNP